MALPSHSTARVDLISNQLCCVPSAAERFIIVKWRTPFQTTGGRASFGCSICKNQNPVQVKTRHLGRKVLVQLISCFLLLGYSSPHRGAFRNMCFHLIYSLIHPFNFFRILPPHSRLQDLSMGEAEAVEGASWMCSDWLPWVNLHNTFIAPPGPHGDIHAHNPATLFLFQMSLGQFS